MEVLGLDHLYLTVSDLDRSEAFYDAVLALLGFRKGDRPIAGERHAHYFNRVMQISLRPARNEAAHDPYAPGLHHLCLQLPTSADVDTAARSLLELGIDATHPKHYPEYNPDYYACFFEDPDGLRLELICRTPYRDELVRDWNDYEVFLNPVADLRAKRDAG